MSLGYGLAPPAGFFWAAAALYAVVFVVALVQLVRFVSAAPAVWTTQKLFHLLVGAVACIRTSFNTAAAEGVIFQGSPVPALLVMYLAAVATISAYVLLVLYWAQVYASAQRTSSSVSMLPLVDEDSSDMPRYAAVVPRTWPCPRGIRLREPFLRRPCPCRVPRAALAL